MPFIFHILSFHFISKIFYFLFYCLSFPSIWFHFICQLDSISFAKKAPMYFRDAPTHWFHAVLDYCTRGVRQKAPPRRTAMMSRISLYLSNHHYPCLRVSASFQPAAGLKQWSFFHNLIILIVRMQSMCFLNFVCHLLLQQVKAGRGLSWSARFLFKNYCYGPCWLGQGSLLMLLLLDDCWIC